MAPLGDQFEPSRQLEAQGGERLAPPPRGRPRRSAAGRPARRRAARSRPRSPLARGTSRSGSASAPSSCTNAHTSPFAPCCLANWVSASSSERGSSRAPALSPFTTPPRDQGAREHLELGRAERVGEVGQLEPEAAIRSVEPTPGRSPRQTSPRPRRRWRQRTFALEHRGHRSPPSLDHVVLVDKRHLDVELRELGQRSARESSSRKQRTIW